jgi:hypothetical protein
MTSKSDLQAAEVELQEWARLAMHVLAKAYGENEPEYLLGEIIQNVAENQREDYWKRRKPD